MNVTPPSPTMWRRSLIVVAAGLLALAGVGPALGGARDPGLPRAATSSDAADPWPASSTFPVPTPAIRGADGLTPGGKGTPVPIETDDALPLPSGALTAGSLTAGSFAVEPDAARLPATCPATAWRTAPVPGPVSAPTVLVALAPDAPDTCQGFTGLLPVVVTPAARAATIATPSPSTAPGGASGVMPGGSAPAPAGITATSVVPVAVAVLATPGISVRAEGAVVTVLPIAPTSGPVPDTYDVEIRDLRVDWSPVCTTRDPATCEVARDDESRGRTYRVTARLGGWRRSSPPVAFPAPRPN